MAPPRAYWSGHIRLSLVSVPVRLHTATTSTGKLLLHKIHGPTGERVRHQNVVPERGPVENDEIVKGYEYEMGRYVTFTDEELEAIRIESKQIIDLVQFVGAREIDPLYYERPYFVVPDGALGEEAFAVLREALRASGRVGIGQVVLAGKERIAALRPCGRGMVLETLRYKDELRSAKAYFDEIEEKKVDPDQIDLAKELIDRKTAPFDASRFEDHYQEALQDLARSKIEHRSPSREKKRDLGPNVIDLMDALKRSLRQGGGGSKGGAAARSEKKRAAPRTKKPQRRKKSA